MLSRLPLAAASLAALLACPDTPSAQVDSIPAQSGASLFLEGGIALHDNGQGMYGFSAATGEWTLVAPSGSNVLDRDDWMALVQRPDGQLVFFVGRTGRTFLPPAAASNFNTNAQRGTTDEIGYVAYPVGGGTWQLYCLCAKGGETWNFTQEITPHVARGAVVASDRLGLQQFHVGFGARTGYFEMTQLENSFLRTYSGTGNLVCVETPDQLHVFSGVFGLWNTQPLPESFDVDDNVAWKRDWINQAENTVRYSAFSAYDLEWIEQSSGLDLDLVTPVEFTGSNWCCIRRTASVWDAIGARPHEAWGSTTLLNSSLTPGDDGFVLVQNGFQARAFSGLRSGDFDSINLTGATPTIDVLEHAFHVQYAGNSRVFSPFRDAWTVPIVGTTGSATDRALGRSGGLLRKSGLDEIVANSCRSASLPAWPGGSSSNAELFAAGSLYAIVDPDDSFAVWIYDPRLSNWQDPLYPGSDPVIEGDGNVICVSGAAGTWAYTAQTSNWIELDDPSTNDVVVAGGQMFVRKDLAVVVDNGFLTAVAAPGDVHAWYDYPESRDFHALAQPGPAIFTNFDATLRLPAGTLVSNYYSNFRLSDGAPVPLPVSGLLWINPFFAIDTFVTSADQQVWSVPLPSGAAGFQQYWTQSVYLTPSGVQPFAFSDAPQALPIF